MEKPKENKAVEKKEQTIHELAEKHGYYIEEIWGVNTIRNAGTVDDMQRAKLEKTLRGVRIMKKLPGGKQNLSGRIAFCNSMREAERTLHEIIDKLNGEGEE